MTRILQSIAVIGVLTGSVAAQTNTTFTYQGELRESGEPADGSFDMDFALWDAPGGGSQVGSSVQVVDQPVSDGLFTVELDFGAEVFDGSQLWLEITVEGTTLAPRQPITNAPYSIQTRGIFVDDDGNVGIGTLTPAAPLEVHNANTGQIMRLESDRTYGYVQFREGATTRAYLGYGDEGDLLVNALPDSFAIDGTSTALHFAVDSDAAKGITVDPDGQVGIGTTNPAARLSVGGDGDFYSAIWGEATGESELVGVTGRTASAIGVGVFGWAPDLGVYGEGDAIDGVGVSGYAPGAEGHGVEGNGGQWDFYAANEESGDYGSASSIRWKRNIVEIDEALKKLAALRGVYFDWDAEHGGHHDVGMIAEEVGEVLPEVVQYEENGVDTNGMDYGKLTPLLVEAVNALREEKDAEIALRDERIESLEQTNAELEARLARLEAIVDELASRQEIER
jgi:hypothetical protein